MYVRWGARAGAAAFALGLSLAGPQAFGVAAAAPDDSAAASDSSAGAGRSGRGDHTRSERIAEPSRRSGGSVAARPARPGAARKTPLPAATAPLSSRRISLSAPSAAVEAAAPAESGTVHLRARARLISGGAGAASSSPGSVGWLAAAAPANPFGGDLLEAVADWVAGLPNKELSDFLAGALTLVRRNLFDSEPVASPVQEGTNESGQILGTIGAIDLESDPLGYRVVTGPTFGAVVVSDDGSYVYTPGAQYAGSDSFTVRITDTTDGFNLLAVGDDGLHDVNVVVGVGAPTNPFGATNLANASLFLANTSADITVVKQQGKLFGSVSMSVADETSLLWLDEEGRIGSISAADVAKQWDGIENAGGVRLGLGFTLDDGSSAALVMTSVQATSAGAGQYVFTGLLAPMVDDSAAVNTFWDVVGNTYEASYENFLRASGVDVRTFTSFSQTVNGADLHLDTYSVADYLEVLATSDPGQPVSSDSLAMAAAQTASASTWFDSTRARWAIEYAQNGGKAAENFDPLFSSFAFLPACTLSSCPGSIYSMNFSLPMRSLASVTRTFAGEGQSATLSLDFQETSYGYVYVPSGVWDKLDSDLYSFAFMLALTAGPSVQLNLGGKNGDLTIASTSVKGPGFSSVTTLGMFAVNTALTAGLTAKLELPQSFTKDSLTGNAYVTGAFVLDYNTIGDRGRFGTASAFYLDKDFSDFEQVSSATIVASLTPSITGSWGLFTPDISWLPQLTVAKATLKYSNPLDATLTVAKGSTSLTLGSKGDLGFDAEFLPKFTSLTYSPSTINLYTYRTGSLV